MKGIHKFEVMGERFALNVNSLAVYKIDHLTADILELAGQRSRLEIEEALQGRYPPPQIRDALRELDEVEEDGRPFAEEAPPHARQAVHWRNLVLQIAHDCNLRCKYCFAGQGRYNGGRTLMSREIAERAIDLFIEESGPGDDLSLNLFGGEPLLNMRAIEHVVSYARGQGDERGKTFNNIALVTNGTLLTDDIVRYLNENRIALKVSIDGPAEVHDRMRLLPNGRGSHELAVSGLSRVMGSGLADRTTLRATYCGATLEISRLFAYLAETGFRGVEIEAAALPEQSPFAIRKEHLPTVRAEYQKVAELYLQILADGRSFVFGSLENLLWRLRNGIPKYNECRAGEGSVTVAPNGTLFPCFELDGCAGYDIGDVYAGFDQTKRKVWLDTHDVAARVHCGGCWARLLCGGGCRAHGIKFKGDMLSQVDIECELKKLQFEVAVWLLSRLQEELGGSDALSFLEEGVLE